MNISRILITTAAAFSLVGLSGAALAQTYQGMTDTERENIIRMNREAAAAAVPDSAGNSTYRDAAGNMVYRDTNGNITYRDASGNVVMNPPIVQGRDTMPLTTQQMRTDQQQMRSQRVARADRN